jgi:hypothetical protein
MRKLKFLNDTLHGVLDYAVVAIFALAPLALGIDGASALLCYALAVIHLILTLLTDMPLGLMKVIPIRVHGTIELLVGLALIIVPWLLSDLLRSGQLFFTLMGAIIFVVWVSSNYGDKKFAVLS